MNSQSGGLFPLQPHQHFEVVQDFVAACADLTSIEDLSALLEDSCAELGFDYFAIVHHIRFGRPFNGKVRISNYPIDWIAILREEMGETEPVLRAAERTSSGFTWSRLAEMVSLTERDDKYMKRAARYGLAQGYTVPNHVPGETFGSCHFAVGPEKELPESSLPAAQALGCFAFEAARQILRSSSDSETHVVPAPLTDRQRDCVVFAARGKSDWIIAELLNIRPRTVNEHIEAAKRRYCVATRTQLVVRALFRSEICYSEVID